MSDPVNAWFPAWLEQHKANNPHNGWGSFEAPGRPRVYLGWIRAFAELGVTRSDASAASLKLQRSGEVWPVDHLARLLAILGPMVSSRNAEADAARRRRESEEWARLQDERRAARESFRALPEPEREARLASIRFRYPALAELPRVVEWFAVDEWRGIELPDPGLSPAAAGLIDSIGYESPADEPRLTAGQVRFLAALTEAQRARLDAATPARRREILAPFAERFDRRLVAVMEVELRSLAMEAAGRGEPIA